MFYRMDRSLRVDEACPGLDVLWDVESLVDVPGEDTRGQTVLAVVGPEHKAGIHIIIISAADPVHSRVIRFRLHEQT